MRVSLCAVARPTSARSRTSARTGHRPVLKSPAVCQRYVTIAHGPPSFDPWPPTPTSNLFASTRSVTQNGVPATPTATEGDGRTSYLISVGENDESGLRRENEGAVRVRGNAEENRNAPQGPGGRRPSLERAEQEEKRGDREEEEEAVHPCVHAVEEKDPASGNEGRRDQRGASVGDSSPEEGNERQARYRERGGNDPHAAKAEPEMSDRPGEEKVERRTAPVAGDVLDDARDAVASDEESECLVFVWRPGHQLVAEKDRCGNGDRSDCEPEAVCRHKRSRYNERRSWLGTRGGVLCHVRSRQTVAGRFPA